LLDCASASINAPSRQRDKIIVIEANKRRFQYARQRQIVFAQQRRAAERPKVHNGDVIHQIESIGAGDRNMLLLERANHRFEKSVAFAHKDQNVAGLDRARPVFAFDPFAFVRIEQRFDLAGDLARKTHGGIVNAHIIERQAPIRRRCVFDRADGLPNLDEAGRVGLPGGMLRRGFL
jgi:hypothetical protein